MGVIQGLDTIPTEIQRDFGPQFEALLPGWEGAGEYNFKPGAATQKATAQLNVLLQNGSHPWINNQLKTLLRGSEFQDLLPDEKTRRLSALVNFMSEANSPEAIANNGAKTGGYIAFSSRSDPNLTLKLGYQPTTQQMRTLGTLGTTNGLSWTNILNSQAGQEALALNPRVVNGVLEFDGKLNNGGFFSKTAAEIDAGGWRVPFGCEDGDIVLFPSALGGADLWYEETVRRKLFMRSSFINAIAEAGLIKEFRLKQCRIAENELSGFGEAA